MTAPLAPRAAWLAGFGLSFAMTALVVVFFLVSSPSPPMSYALPALLSALAAFVFTVVWPAGTWRWGIVMSSGFWLFFLVAFLAYLTIREWDTSTLLRAGAVLLAGLGGSALAVRLRGPRRGQRIGD